MIHETIGDLLIQPVDIIAHQTNCVGVMGAGIARQIKDKLLPIEEYQKYINACKTYGSNLLGTTQLLFLPSGKIIANCFGENIPTGSGLDTDYNALMHSLARVRNYARKYHLSVGLPGLMGCGLAGGDWNIVRDIIYKLFDKDIDNLTICYYSQAMYDKNILSGSFKH